MQGEQCSVCGCGGFLFRRLPEDTWHCSNHLLNEKDFRRQPIKETTEDV
jgi:hypothetical protein